MGPSLLQIMVESQNVYNMMQGASNSHLMKVFQYSLSIFNELRIKILKGSSKELAGVQLCPPNAGSSVFTMYNIESNVFTKTISMQDVVEQEKGV